VGHLKEAIKAKCPVKLASVDPFNLTLYRIDLKVTDEAGAPPFRDTVEMKMKELKEKGESPLHPAFNVRKYYPTELEGEMVQIFAQVPESESANTATKIVLWLMLLTPQTRKLVPLIRVQTQSEYPRPPPLVRHRMAPSITLHLSFAKLMAK